jgi:ParB-like chromosome segregation protein Spo0J
MTNEKLKKNDEKLIWKIETRKLKDLREHPKNPRKLSKNQHDHLTRSLEKFGVAEKPIINIDGMIIGGHQRLKVLKKLGYKEIECWVPSEKMDEKQCDELNIRLNRGGSFDFDELANSYDIADLLDWGFSATEFHIDLEEPSSEEEEEPEKCPTCGKKTKKTR